MNFRNNLLAVLPLLFCLLALPSLGQLSDYEAKDWLEDRGAYLLENYEKIVVTQMKVEGIGGIGISLPCLRPISGVKTFGLVYNDGPVYSTALLYTQCAVLSVNGRNIVLLANSYQEMVNGILTGY